MKKLLRSIVLTLGSAVLATSAYAQNWEQVTAAAKKEGSVVMYSAAVGAPTVKEINRLFEAKYGIRVQLLEARASELRERVRAEQSAGRFLGDVMYNGSTTTDLMQRDGALQAVGQLPAASNFVAPWQADETRTPINALCYGLLVNNNLVKPGEEPKSWKDLANPKWQGKIISDDVRALGGGSIFFFVTHEAFGSDYHKALAKQNLHFSRDIRNEERRVARGEYPLYMPEVLPYFLQLKGLPVRFVVPQEGCPYVRFDMTRLKSSPHPNAAQLLSNFYLEKEAQLVFANAGFNPVKQGVVEAAAPEVRDLLKTKPMGTSNVDRQAEMLELANQIYKR
ncbi:MAG: extracellular solute-binding protein [Ottowia sp.]|uniref:ABC transporter substrate-binding protein n=1 Tax=Ottowia sp. TaxID=1898956 RepID=UPI003C75CE6A